MFTPIIRMGPPRWRKCWKWRQSRGITHLSLVDHDTVAGIEAAQFAGEKHGITIIPGIEISAYDFTRNRKVHILGYWFDKEATHIQELCRAAVKKTA